MQLRNLHQDQNIKLELSEKMKLLNEKKGDISKGKYDDTLKELNEKELNDHSFDYKISLENIPEDHFNYKFIQEKVEVISWF